MRTNVLFESTRFGIDYTFIIVWNKPILSIYLLNNKSLLELKFFSGEMKYMLFITFFFFSFYGSQNTR